uniref:Uncharacterized protein n=1 Tax=Setaria italica TaxID=4555 RepID=K4A4G8_SETIT
MTESCYPLKHIKFMENLQHNDPLSFCCLSWAVGFQPCSSHCIL